MNLKNILRYLLLIEVFGNVECLSFIRPYTKMKTYSLCNNMVSPKNNNEYNHNKSKIYKVTFSNDKYNDDNDFFEPKYNFGLSQFDFTLLKITINTIIIIYLYQLL